ncbi:alpha-mannosidase [Pediococcus pentosaceus]|uniref:glycoside hydrolase family 38 N-terminal domain-containing protein n=1 Tax=Pediococcus pentosaceus TaxID=1255 RepID=UPI003F25CA2D
MTNVHIVNHTHWDREWYFTSMDALVLSDQLFSDILTELEEHKEANFVLDGQLSILDEFISLYPEKITEIKTLVKKNQLFIGPWYTQSDANFTSGEAILRNAMIGDFESKKYGKKMCIGYLPDTFGFNAQMPVILQEAGLDNIVMWRGLNLNKHVKSPYFKWAGMGNKNTVYAINMPQGYGTGMLLEDSVDFVDGRLDPAVKFIKAYVDKDILIPSGNDQLAIIHDLKKQIDKINKIGKYNYQISSYPNFLETLKKDASSLETYKGELRDPVLARIHKTIGSVRMDIKQEIFHLEDKLTFRIEPLMVIAKKVGINLSNRLLVLAWKKLLECQAHDSLSGCVSDSVANDIKHRLKESNEICNSIENIILKQISDYLDMKENEILVVNSSVKKFIGNKTVTVLSKNPNICFEEIESQVLNSKYVDSRENILNETPAGNQYITEDGYYILTIEIKCELPPLGFKVYRFNSDSYDEQKVMVKNKSIKGKKIEILFDGSTVIYKDQNVKIFDFVSLIDEGNAGDTYDFSPLKNAMASRLEFNHCICYSFGEYEEMKLEGNVKLPYTLEDRINHTSNKEFNFKIDFLIDKNDEIKIKVDFENTVLNHRVRLALNMGEVIKYAKASIPFGYIKRENIPLNHWKDKYVEMPVNVEPFDKEVSVNTDNYSFNVFTTDTREYEYLGNKIYFTLVATTDSLGKPNLLYRPGRASGDTTKKGHIMINTPMAQLEHQKMSFEFWIKKDKVNPNELRLAEWKHQKILPNIAYQNQNLNYFINRIDNKIQKFDKNIFIEREYSVLQGMSIENLVSSVYNSYYEKDAFVIRFENPTNEPIQLPIDTYFDRFQVTRINALEEEQTMTSTIDEYGVLSFLVKTK